MKILCSFMLILVLVLGNIYFAFNYFKERNRSTYFETQFCEMEQLNMLSKNHKPGAAKEHLLASCSSRGLECEEVGSNLNIEVKGGCPVSGRQYCGYIANFKDGLLNSIYSGYPCH
jgi:hypothetical protein